VPGSVTNHRFTNEHPRHKRTRCAAHLQSRTNPLPLYGQI
jgi:hypothetical protein